MQVVVLVAAFVLAASDDTIHYDQNKADAIAEMRGVEPQVEECMHDGALTMLQSGVRSRSFILKFTVQTCGSVPTIILRKHHCPDKYIADYLSELASDELKIVLQENQ